MTKTMVHTTTSAADAMGTRPGLTRRVVGIALTALFAAGLAVGPRTSAFAGDEGLYDAPPPPGSAFVRVIAPGAGGSSEMAGETVALSADGSTPYRVVKAGTLPVAIADEAGEATLEAGKFYTVLPGPDGPAAVEDAPLANPARAALYFYNLTDGPLGLRATADGKALPVFEAIEPGGSNQREVGALRVGFEVTDAEGAVRASIEPIFIEKRTGTSIVVTDDGEAIRAIALNNEVAR